MNSFGPTEVRERERESADETGFWNWNCLVIGWNGSRSVKGKNVSFVVCSDLCRYY